MDKDKRNKNEEPQERIDLMRGAFSDMNTYRRCKAKRDVKAGELVDMTTVEVFGKPVHTPMAQAEFLTGQDIRDYTAILGGERPFVKTSEAAIMSSIRVGRNTMVIMSCLDMQKRHDSFVLFVPNLKQLDYFVAAGIQPSNIRLPSELGDAGHAFRITPDGIVKA